MHVIDRIFELFEQHGDEHYVAELVTQRAHALQAAALAESESAWDNKGLMSSKSGIQGVWNL